MYENTKQRCFRIDHINHTFTETHFVVMKICTYFLNKHSMHERDLCNNVFVQISEIY